MSRFTLWIWIASYRLEERRQQAVGHAELLIEAVCCVSLMVLRRFS